MSTFLQKIPITYPICLAFIAGLILGSIVPPDKDLRILSMSILSLLLVGFLFRREKIVLLLSVCLSVLIIGILRFQASIPSSRNFKDKSVAFEGVVAATPRRVRGNQRIEILSKELAIGGKILITTTAYPEYQYGDILKILGYIKQPPEFEEFSYKDYLVRKGIYAIMIFPEINKIGEGGNPIRQKFLEARKRFEETSDKIFPEPQSSLLVGIVVGIEREIPKQFENALKQSGLLHVVVVSGYNMTLVIVFFYAIFSFLGRRKSFSLSALGILLYLLLVGFSAPVVRAAVMAWLGLLGKTFGRQRQSLLILLVSATLILFLNPQSIGSISFQLSFAATLGLIILSGSIETSLFFLPKKIAEVVASTLAALVFVFPILAYNFGSVSLVAPLSNALTVLLIEPILFFGTLAVVSYTILPVLGSLLSIISWVPLTAFVIIADLMSKPSWSSVTLSGGGFMFWFFYYVVLGFVVFYYKGVHYSTTT